MLINFIGNSIKFTTKGFIVVQALDSQYNNNLITVSVKDSGCGIPK